ncbi:MAG: hypothetical protein PHT19_17490 [Methylococcus sp.]|nr:hypothetical protein [Methylococcus sp.]
MYRNLRHCQDCEQLKAQPHGQAVCGFRLSGPALQVAVSLASLSPGHGRTRSPALACAYTLRNGESSTQSSKIAAHTPGLPRQSFSRTPPQCWDCPYYAGQAQKDHTRSCSLGRRQHWYWGPGDNLVIQAFQAQCEPLFPHIDALREGIDRSTGELSPDYVAALQWFQDHPQSPAPKPAQDRTPSMPFHRRTGAPTRTPDTPASPLSA